MAMYAQWIPRSGWLGVDLYRKYTQAEPFVDGARPVGTVSVAAPAVEPDPVAASAPVVETPDADRWRVGEERYYTDENEWKRQLDRMRGAIGYFDTRSGQYVIRQGQVAQPAIGPARPQDLMQDLFRQRVQDLMNYYNTVRAGRWIDPKYREQAALNEQFVMDYLDRAMAKQMAEMDARTQLGIQKLAQETEKYKADAVIKSDERREKFELEKARMQESLRALNALRAVSKKRPAMTGDQYLFMTKFEASIKSSLDDDPDLSKAQIETYKAFVPLMTDNTTAASVFRAMFAKEAERIKAQEPGAATEQIIYKAFRNTVDTFPEWAGSVDWSSED